MTDWYFARNGSFLLADYIQRYDVNINFTHFVMDSKALTKDNIEKKAANAELQKNQGTSTEQFRNVPPPSPPPNAPEIQFPPLVQRISIQTGSLSQSNKDSGSWNSATHKFVVEESFCL